jgi:predicted ArsR family transcriptional regulator
MSGTVEETSVKTAEATVSAAGMRIVRLLVGNPPQTVAEMIRATGVTRTAVTEQLNELVAAGFVERTTERLPGRGRPRHLYSATRASLLLLFANNQRLVVPAVWRAIDQVGGQELTQKVLAGVSADLAEYYGRRITGTTPEERLQQMRQLLEDEGGIVEVREDEEGQLIMRRRSCPFISMFEESRAVCRVDKQVLSLVVGAPVEQKASRHDGAPCCTFELLSANGK